LSFDCVTVASNAEAADLVDVLTQALLRLSDEKSHEAIIQALLKLAIKENEAEGDEKKDRIWKMLVKFAHDELERASSPSRTLV
jgi:hypothetical protein